MAAEFEGAIDTKNSSSSRKRKLDGEEDVFKAFHEKILKDEPNIINMLDKLKSERYAMAPLEIVSCNAADPALGGVCFTQATCTMIPKPKKVAFANIFVDAFIILKKFFKDQKDIPDDKEKRMMLSKLLKFLMNKDIQEPLCSLEDCSDETELSVLCSVHLFSQLSASPAFTIDDSKSHKVKWCPCAGQRCPCGRRKAKATYGDNSLGNTSVWHGYVDIIMEGAEVIIETMDGEETVKDVENVNEVKQKSFQLDDLSPTSCVAQMAAKTIVYSLFYHKLHPENQNLLIPCIGICKKGLVFYFFDSVNDVMLGSTMFGLTESTHLKKLKITTVIALWMVLNHKHFCNGKSCINMPSAGFLKFAENKLEVYRNELRRGNVHLRYGYASVDPLSFETSDFSVAKELEDI